MPITPRFLRCTHRQCFRVFLADLLPCLCSSHFLFAFVLQSILPNERGEPLPTDSTIPRLTPHPVTVGAFLFLRHGKTIRSIPRTRFCCPKTGGWRFRLVFERNERNRKSTLPPRQKKKSKSFPAGVRLRPVLVDHVGLEPTTNRL